MRVLIVDGQIDTLGIARQLERMQDVVVLTDSPVLVRARPAFPDPVLVMPRHEPLADYEPWRRQGKRKGKAVR